jgi:hypothetical protein
MSFKHIQRYFLYAGILGFIAYALHDILGSLLYQGYNPASQAVSDLTALNSPVLNVTQPLSFLYGVMSVLVMSTVVYVLRKNPSITLKQAIYGFLGMHLISFVGYGLFPLSEAGQPNTFTDIMHIYAVTIPVVMLSIYALVCFIVFGQKQKEHTQLKYVAGLSLLMMFIGAMLSNLVHPSVFGIFERFSTYSAVLFTAYLGIYTNHKLTE